MEKRCSQCRQTFWRHPKSNMTRCQNCPPPLRSYPMHYEKMGIDPPEQVKRQPKPFYTLKRHLKISDAEKTGSILANIDEEE